MWYPKKNENIKDRQIKTQACNLYAVFKHYNVSTLNTKDVKRSIHNHNSHKFGVHEKIENCKKLIAIEYGAGLYERCI